MKRYQPYSKIIHYFFLWAILITSHGCTDEDLAECGEVEVRFRYTNHVYGSDRFSEEVRRITLYLFDSKGLFVSQFSDEGDHLDENYSVLLDVPPGEYSFVVWGNLCEHFETTSFVPGETRLEEAKLHFIHPQNDVNACLAEGLFYGGEFQQRIKPSLDKTPVVTLDLTKNSNHIQVKTTGSLLTRSISMNSLKCFITSQNGAYQFDNSITEGSSSMRVYEPTSIITEEGHFSEFYTLRELEDESTHSRLIIQSVDENGVEEELLNTALVPLLLRVSSTGNLDTDDHYELDVELNYTNGTVTVKVNGWQISQGGVVVG